MYRFPLYHISYGRGRKLSIVLEYCGKLLLSWHLRWLDENRFVEVKVVGGANPDGPFPFEGVWRAELGCHLPDIVIPIDPQLDVKLSPT